MAEMLTAKEMQALLQVDRSTIYRMAEAGRLPAIKVGKQWRFPADQVQSWMHSGSALPASVDNGLPQSNGHSGELAALLPLECVQLIQDSFADLLGVMLVVTDMAGKPITQPSNPCGLFQAVSQVPHALERCIQSWHKLAETIDLEPRFSESHLNLLCARALIRDGLQLKGMVVAGCVAPDAWPPSKGSIDRMAAEFGVETDLLASRMDEVHFLSEGQPEKVLAHIQQIANIVAHIICERKTLIGRLEAIADLTSI
ncbi:MAG: PocR ligand-binding domain-containing protein [Chloroflexota bacterium]|nr:MAG: PocR ligand-binding domain-containing protein [Chloroflexota bacterium]